MKKKITVIGHKPINSIIKSIPKATESTRSSPSGSDHLENLRMWLEETKNSPETLAREKLESELNRIKDDPIIKQSETCIEVIEALLYCVVYRWAASDSVSMLQPIADEFSSISQSHRAKLLHEEDYAIKEDIFKWLNENKTLEMTLTDAATTMAEKVVPLKYDAIRKHCTAWNKLYGKGKS